MVKQDFDDIQSNLEKILQDSIKEDTRKKQETEDKRKQAEHKAELARIALEN